MLYCLARTLCFAKKPEEEKQKNLRESISICTRILSDCTDDNLRFRSLQVLAQAYKDIGDKERAVETANRLPLAHDSRDMVLPEVLDGEAKSNQIVQNIWLLSDMFEYPITDEQILDEGFVSLATEIFVAMQPFNAFLNRALEKFEMPLQ